MTENIMITGATSGIGLVTAIFLAEKGYNVLGTTRDIIKTDTNELIEKYISYHTKYKILKHDLTLKETVRKAPIELSKLKLSLSKIKFVQMDVRDNLSIGRAIAEGLKLSHQKVDVLINNAGEGVFGPIEEVTIDQVRQLFETNVVGLLNVIQHILPSMRKNQNGKIINISSLAALMSIPFLSHYSATKAAVERLTEGLRMELKPFNIKVTAIEPGYINTNFYANIINNKKPDLTSENLSNIIPNAPLKTHSPYYQKALKCWSASIFYLLTSSSPTAVANKIYEVIKTKNPKTRYKVGAVKQTIPLYLVQKFFSDNILQFAYEKHYKIM